ncbi:MAG: hypothetical protein QOE90_1874 [Thermoplasmata archaeon]|jgi:hypothetical protein|nr:hypothetical protein [Thermoplasmata archaeon]
MSRSRNLIALAALLVALAGCASPAPAPHATTPSPAAEIAPAALPANAPPAAPPAPLRLYLQPDLALKPTRAAAEASIALPTPVNSQVTYATPAWRGVLAADATLPATLVVVLYAETNSASLSAGDLPPEAGLGLLNVYVTIGNKTYHAAADGPHELVAGQVGQFVAKLTLPPGIAPAGTAIRLDEDVFFSHVQGAAEFRFVMGPQHRAGMSGSFPEAD